MMITITTSGGFAGFGLGRSAAVTVEELPHPLQAEACARLEPEALAALGRQPPPGAADMVVYHIEVEREGRVVAYDVPEGALPPETLDLIDELMEIGAPPER